MKLQKVTNYVKRKYKFDVCYECFMLSTLVAVDRRTAAIFSEDGEERVELVERVM